MAKTEYVTITASIIGETEKAFNIEYTSADDRHHYCWIPKSCVESPDQFEKGDEDVDLPIARWLLDDRGIDY